MLSARGRAPGVRRAALATPVVVLLAGLAALALSDRGFPARLASHGFDEFTEAKFDRQNDPARVLQTNSGNRWVWWEEAAGALFRPPAGRATARARSRSCTASTATTLLEVRQPHNVPLEFLSETGLIGAGLGARRPGPARRRRRSRHGCARRPGRERGFGAALLVGAGAWGLHTAGGLGLGHPGRDPARPGVPRRAGGAPAGHGRGPAARGAVRGRRGVALAAGGGGARWWSRRWRRCPPCRESLTDDALSQAASGKPDDLAEAAEKAALAKRLNPFAVEPGCSRRPSIAERGNQPTAAAGAAAWRRWSASPTTRRRGRDWRASRCFSTTPPARCGRSASSRRSTPAATLVLPAGALRALRRAPLGERHRHAASPDRDSPFSAPALAAPGACRVTPTTVAPGRRRPRPRRPLRRRLRRPRRPRAPTHARTAAPPPQRRPFRLEG